MAVEVVFETHSTSEDNERGAASGWAHSRLSETGRRQAKELGARRRHDGIAAVFSSDLRRAVETAEVAFEGALPVLLDWRLRECDYGDMTQMPVGEVHAASARAGRPALAGPAGGSAQARAPGCRQGLHGPASRG